MVSRSLTFDDKRFRTLALIGRQYTEGNQLLSTLMLLVNR
jgi:hypothetical protein